MKICDVLQEENVILNLKGFNKESIINELTDSLYAAHVITDVDVFKKDIYKREEEGITAIGKGIAIPHGRSDSVIKTSIAIGRTEEPVKWGDGCEELVQIVIMFAVRNTDMSQHIALLSKVATLLCDDSIVNELLASNDVATIISTLGKEV